MRDYLPAQIGGIVGSYALSLIIVALVLIILSKRRRERLTNAENEAEFLRKVDKPQQVVELPPPELRYPEPPLSPRSIPRSPISLNINTNFSSPSIDQSAYVYPASPALTTRSPLGINSNVDQRVVTADKAMAQAQLEDMYKYVMEHDEAKRNGTEPPPIPVLTSDNRSSSALPAAGPSRPSTSSAAPAPTLLKKEKVKPAHLDFVPLEPEKRQSKASSIFSSLMSPKKKPKALSISSPIMTPMSGTFPRESREMNTIPPRQYAPAPPPPLPTDQLPLRASRSTQVLPLTPGGDSPDSSQSIDERLGRRPLNNHSRNTSGVPTEFEPTSANSEHSQAPLVGLPQSPKPGVNRFPTLPASPRSGRFPSSTPTLPLSPKPESSFSRPSAVRTGGTLPLRAYESSLASPTNSSFQTKQTTFERAGPLSPGFGQRTPFTGAAVPYSPYQPFSPMVPVTPSLVTKADRKRMKRLEPKTPTVAMVQSAEDMW
ncbi:uncharacterized protein DNG_07605 [Cephalotrichum gorgonifer]|uniref:Uncharacterized protein n=1 Tax=Cephalotrichum gorgonifer TaxID=2041049 RepID=A0AAE8SXK4_9PEZI|nr:uncharacterized protein DNG_07605 [Cephalotrichum gorgonifer]